MRIFSAYKLNEILLKNRFVMAPMTRCRSTQPGDIPNELMAKYYGQRTSAGLIITEGNKFLCKEKVMGELRVFIPLNKWRAGKRSLKMCIKKVVKYSYNFGMLEEFPILK